MVSLQKICTRKLSIEVDIVRYQEVCILNSALFELSTDILGVDFLSAKLC